MEIKFNVPLAKYTSYRVGGCAKIYVKPKNLQELSKFIQELPKADEIFWLGLGSNVLIRDGGFDGAVIHTHNVLNNIEIIDQINNGLLVKVGAGVSCAKLAKFCVRHNLIDGIWFAGIPGTIGGALYMNAGAFGGETWQHVVSVDVINHKGMIFNRTLENYTINYRNVVLKQENQFQEWFVSGTLFFKFSDLIEDASIHLEKKINLLLQQRKSTQPIGTLNCGSVFKNPPNNYAGKLIETAQLKGQKFGGAIVSEKHANFIINSGVATANDIEQLINLIKLQVLNIHQVVLETEVKIIGKSS
jgi:UDP-N-acetylmuramate dehydrogenase